MLLQVLDDYPDRSRKVEVASDIAWLAADQNISPEEVIEGGPGEGVEYLKGLVTISEMSEGSEDMAPDVESQATDLAKRWRSIRAKAIKSIL
jgi:hypothetical protein